MASIASCLKCGTGPAGAGGICTACAIRANRPQMLDEMMKSFGMTAKIWQDTETQDKEKTDNKIRYNLNPIVREQDRQKRAKQYFVIDNLFKQNSINNINSTNYKHNPNIGGYVSNSTRQLSKYVFLPEGYIIRQSSIGSNKGQSISYTLSKPSYFSNSTSTSTSSPTYTSSSSNYSTSSSSSTVAGGKK